MTDNLPEVIDEPNKGGRPTLYSEALADLICERLADGESLRAICSEPDMPCKASVFKWLRDNKQFSDQYARAREEQAETLADEIIEIADETYLDHKVNDRGNVVVDNEAIQRSKLRVEARKWIAAKLKPKRYGEKLDLTSSDGTMSPNRELTEQEIADELAKRGISTDIFNN